MQLCKSSFENTGGCQKGPEESRSEGCRGEHRSAKVSHVGVAMWELSYGVGHVGMAMWEGS